jgi:hypothetical protein
MKKMSSVSFGAAALALGLLLSGCNHGLGASHAAPVADETIGNNPGAGVMSVATAKAVFDFSYQSNGVVIEKFKDAGALGDYLYQSGGTSGGNLNVVSLSLSGFPLLDIVPGEEGTFRIKSIGDLPVVAILANAFNPDTTGVADITSVVKRVVLPETISELGSNLFAGVAAEITVEIPPAVTERVAGGNDAERLHDILGGEAKIEVRDENVPLSAPVVIEPTVPTVSGVEVSGNPGSLTVKLTYSAAVNSVSLNGNSSGWSGFTGSGTTFTTTYSGSTDASPVTLGYRAGYSGGTKTAALSVSLATGDLARGNSAATYQFFAYDALNYAVGLKTATAGSDDPTVETNTQTTWYRLGGANEKIRAVFDAIYAPNSPTSRDGFVEGADPGKTAVPYDKTISDKVLKLFYVTLGNSTDEKGDKVYIKGETLPEKTDANPVASVTNLVIIDVGVPGGDGKDLPHFYIPVQGLGSAEVEGGTAGGTLSQDAYKDANNYSHIRLRVNNGAELVILADNSNYENGNAGGKACPPGKFAGGVVEVVKGGRLRDGAWEGFPLGNNAVILNRTDSYLAVGSESAMDVTTDNTSNNVNELYYSGWIIGPETANNARIVWDGGPPAQYIEVRPGRLATNANVTVKRTLGLIYKVWFVGPTTLTINAKDDAVTPGFGTDSAGQSIKGLAVNNDTTNTFLFYGNSGASIVVTQGSSIMNAPLGITGDTFTTAYSGSGSTTIKAYEGPAGSLGTYIENDVNSIKGYNSWAKQ